MLGVIKEVLGLGPAEMQSGDLEFYVTDYEGQTDGAPRLIDVDLRGESERKWLISGFEVLGPRRWFRRKRFPVAFFKQDPPEWTERLTLVSATPGYVFQLHDDAPRGFTVRVHVRGRFNAGKNAYRDEPYETFAYKVDWGSSGRKPAGQR